MNTFGIDKHATETGKLGAHPATRLRARVGLRRPLIVLSACATFACSFAISRALPSGSAARAESSAPNLPVASGGAAIPVGLASAQPIAPSLEPPPPPRASAPARPRGEPTIARNAPVAHATTPTPVARRGPTGRQDRPPSALRASAPARPRALAPVTPSLPEPSISAPAPRPSQSSAPAPAPAPAPERPAPVHTEAPAPSHGSSGSGHPSSGTFESSG